MAINAKQTMKPLNTDTTDSARLIVQRCLLFGTPLAAGLVGGIHRARTGDAGLEQFLANLDQYDGLNWFVTVGGAAAGSESVGLGPMYGMAKRVPLTHGESAKGAFIGAALVYGTYKILERVGYGAGLLIGSL